MTAKQKPADAEPLPDPDDVLRVMLNTPPQPHTGGAAPAKRAKPPRKKRPAKQRA